MEAYASANKQCEHGGLVISTKMVQATWQLKVYCPYLRLSLPRWQGIFAGRSDVAPVARLAATGLIYLL